MVQWLAFFFSILALVTSAHWRTVEELGFRVGAIEARKCTLMEVVTPSGTATICTHQ